MSKDFKVTCGIWSPLAGSVMLPVTINRPSDPEDDWDQVQDLDSLFTGQRLKIMIVFDPNKNESDVDGQSTFRDFGAFVCRATGSARFYRSFRKHREVRLVLDRVDDLGNLRSVIHRAATLTAEIAS